MNNIKYTSDGKKVLVVGKLNAEQTIVQEIFVSNGQEIPSGENFVVKSLHDQPAESWKEKTLRELESRYESQRKKLEAEINDQYARLSNAKEKARHHADALFKFIKNGDSSHLDLLKKFAAGQVTHIFVGGYSPEIIDWLNDDKGFDVDRYNGRRTIEGIKLVSLFGYSDGSLEYRLHSYRDGSGGSEQVFPTTSYAEALAMAQADFDAQCAAYLAGTQRSISLDSWKKIEGIVVPADVMAKHQQEAEAHRKARIKQLRDELAKLESA
ncbi:hypothetical protein [Aquipseudomonas alcaligenes]|uniref:hypothetical protein n=1 Tax=Aquipseudomonas alcaligenes TaxID=43263 RepID=UPI00365FEBF3